MSKNQDNLEVGANIYSDTVFVKIWSGATSLTAEMGPESAVKLSKQLKVLAENIIKDKRQEQMDYMDENRREC